MNTMQKLVRTGFIYAIAAMAGGVFYREFTKFNGFTGNTSLGFVHTHLFLLGMFFFLIAVLLEGYFHLSEHRFFGKFFVIYNIGVPLTALMLLVRGVLQVKAAPLSAAASAAVSGIAGVGHILTGVGIVLFFLMLKAQAGSKGAQNRGKR